MASEAMIVSIDAIAAIASLTIWIVCSNAGSVSCSTSSADGGSKSRSKPAALSPRPAIFSTSNSIFSCRFQFIESKNNKKSIATAKASMTATLMSKLETCSTLLVRIEDSSTCNIPPAFVPLDELAVVVLMAVSYANGYSTKM